MAYAILDPEADDILLSLMTHATGEPQSWERAAPIPPAYLSAAGADLWISDKEPEMEIYPRADYLQYYLDTN